MKRIGLLGLCGALLLSLTACASGDNAYNAGMTALQNRNYAKAYDLLLESDDPRAAEVLEDFVFVPVEERRIPHGRGEESVTKHTYNDKGWPIHYETTNQGIVSPVDYTYDEKGNLLSVVDGDGVTKKYTYDAAGNQISIIGYTLDKETSRQEYRYDQQNRLVEQVNTDVSGTITYQWAYDQADRQTKSKHIDANGDWLEMTMEYDDRGNVVKTRIQKSDGTWQESTAEYDEKGNKTRAWNKNSEGSNHESRYEYDAAGRCLIEHHPSGTVEYTYDEAGRKLSEKTLFDERKEYTYDQQGRLVLVKTTQEGGNEHHVSYTYDEAGRVASRTSVSGMSTQVFSCTYDQYGNLLSRRQTTDGNVFEYTYQWAVYYYPDGLTEMVRLLAESTENMHIKVEN